MPGLSGKKIVITGGTSGMGLATARHFLARGASVLVTGRSEASLQRARSVLGDAAVVVHSDTGALADIDALAATVRAAFTGIDLLFLNAGITMGASVFDVTEQTYDDVFDINTKGAFFAAQKLAPLVNDGGAIVFTTSAANVQGLAGSSVYAASKAALRSFTRGFARELLPRKIRVNAISPGPIDTGILDRSLPAEAAGQLKAGFIAGNPMQRMGSTEEIARAVQFLGFDATYTTGAELPVGGGATQL
ncbi:short-chain dehydrogenase [Amycolatopsis mediterranei S699]|uniref:Short-chain dehydrogenase n=2 Tax=Amycolatopsis mediterranei TaxID=33910 RepID=A0A0H3CXA8_AMYMU|nr:SDR family oxidoreductase [Amycolatopsis mediterranei]ADJ43252.1 short-chain dehydrogenase [Amycolatopsis mediterranei U32]AEK39950.1 short-chain dehydrogenase [Amycolatopsis mediterranei S699]AFO74965.1 short-chain dehydrogenase [Amycolatopsis mediterranei S699]AGT82094.1 short-chain dehydrogenase [Amycolatopsis mediterranei RB]KDO05164.1 short-chain dehydrogenase [Amycolatopsis mediterranei]